MPELFMRVCQKYLLTLERACRFQGIGRVWTWSYCMEGERLSTEQKPSAIYYASNLSYIVCCSVVARHEVVTHSTHRESVLFRHCFSLFSYLLWDFTYWGMDSSWCCHLLWSRMFLFRVYQCRQSGIWRWLGLNLELIWKASAVTQIKRWLDCSVPVTHHI